MSGVHVYSNKTIVVAFSFSFGKINILSERNFFTVSFDEYSVVQFAVIFHLNVVTSLTNAPFIQI